LHAGNREEGLIDRCDLVFLAKAKDGDYHQEMNGPIFLNWFENQLMPALKSPSVIVFHILQTKSCIVFCNKPFNLCPNKFYGVQFAMANRGSYNFVTVLDNASYHNIKTEETVVPNFNQRKAVLQDYLSKHNIPFPLLCEPHFSRRQILGMVVTQTYSTMQLWRFKRSL
jgi:hypothetical protein